MSFKIPKSTRTLKEKRFVKFIAKVGEKNPELAKDILYSVGYGGVIGMAMSSIVPVVIFSQGIVNQNPSLAFLGVATAGGLIYAQKKLVDNFVDNKYSFKYAPSKEYPKEITIIAKNKADADKTYLKHIKEVSK